MFIPYAIDRKDIYEELECELYHMEKYSVKMTIRGQKFLVFVKFLLQITDMPQGSSSALCLLILREPSYKG